ncbi:MAG: ABC transporter permease [Oscillospiraceae bacterium]|nr:ABC transporter permease [Oscillospiraceae bacterium]
MSNTTTKGARLGTKKLDMQKLLAPMALVILYILFSIIGENFFTWNTAENILQASYYIGFMAFGVTFIIITGGIDLSLGTVMMCSALLGGYSFKVLHLPMYVSILVTIFTAVAFGFLNGVLVAKLKLPPFIATLGTQMMSAGLGSILTKVQAQTWPPVTDPTGGWFKKIFVRTKLFDFLPIGAVWLLVFFIIAALILHKTKLGRYFYAIGSNEEAARLSGINVDNWKIAAYTLSGFFVGMAALFYAAVYSTITPGVGQGQEMHGITGVIIGGTSMAGGSGTMVGSLIGVFIMSTLKTGLSACGLQAQWQTFFTGLVVIGAVLLDIYRTKTASKVKRS